MSRRAKRLGIVIGIVLGLCLLAAVPGTTAPLKGLPLTVEISSLEELKKALEKATPGSVIRLAAGLYQIYAEDPYFLIKDVQGLPDQPIVIQGAPVREDGKRATIIDGGRSLDPMLELQEHYRRPGNRPIELHDLLIQKQFRTERAINCFVFENVAWLVIENLTVRNCLPASFVIYGNSRYVTIRSSTLVGAMVPVFAGRYSDHLLIENNIWTQDPSGYTEDQSGYSCRVDLTPRPGRMWDTIPWGVVHHGSRAYLNGGLVGSLRAAGSVIIRLNIIRNAYNGVRLRANRFPSCEVCGANLEIYDNEPADIAKNIDRSDDKPTQRCVQRDWAADQTTHPGKRYVPTPEDECSRSRTGKVIKLGPEPVELKEPIYIYNPASPRMKQRF